MKGLTMKREIQLPLMEKVSDYACELPTLWYDRDFLLDHVNGIADDSWYVFDCGHIRWTVHETMDTPRLESKNYKFTEFHKELAELFNPPIMPDTMLYTNTPVGGIPPHQDRNRLAIVNFAVRGKFNESSPQTFYSDFDRDTLEFEMLYTESEQTNVMAPWLFSGPKVHGVKNIDDPDRSILSVCWRHHTYEQVLAGLRDGSFVNWDVNERNKRIKFI